MKICFLPFQVFLQQQQGYRKYKNGINLTGLEDTDMIRESPRGKQLPDEKEQKQNKQNASGHRHILERGGYSNGLTHVDVFMMQCVHSPNKLNPEFTPPGGLQMFSLFAFMLYKKKKKFHDRKILTLIFYPLMALSFPCFLFPSASPHLAD